jgi:chemotaxis protein MotB
MIYFGFRLSVKEVQMGRGLTVLFAICVSALLLLTGCVSSGEYKARLAEIDAYKSDLAGLGKELTLERAAKERLVEELSSLTDRHEKLIGKYAVLEKDYALLEDRLDAKEGELTKEVVALDLKIRDLEASLTERGMEINLKEMRIKELESEIAGLTSEKEEAVSELKGTYEDLLEELKAEVRQGEITITRLKDQLSLSMVDKVLFDSGSAEVKKEGRKVLDRVGAILKKVSDKHIRVEGHTDDVPIGARLKERFPTNWELSTARATNVVRYLQEQVGIDPGRLVASGYSEYRPVASNDTPEGKSRNRRIEIVLIPPDIDRLTEGPQAPADEGDAP